MIREIISHKIEPIGVIFLNNNDVKLCSICSYIYKFVLPPGLVREAPDHSG